MDNALERLKHIGVEKIKEDTKLDITKIDCILNKKFEKLDSVRAKGFINILERQYHLDLSSWLEEYMVFHQTLPQEEKSIEEEIEPSKKHLYLVWGVVGVLGIVVAVLLFSFIPKTSSKKVETQKEMLQEANTNVVKEKTLEEITQEEKQIQNQTQEAPEEKKPQVEQKKISEYGVEIFSNVAFDEENILYIESVKPLWVGIINMDNKKRIAKTKQEFDIPLDKQLLISIAHSDFTLSLDGESKEFKGYLPVYLVYTKEGGLREVNKDEFIYLNGGVQW